MVHLAKIPTNGELAHPLPEVEKLKFELEDADDTATVSVYGSKYAALDLPKHEMPEREMPKEVAYRMIKYDPTAAALLISC
jgi:glutamate decarboxylase